MAHSRQARKRIRQNEKRRLRNKARKSEMRTYIRKVLEAVAARDLEAARQLLPLAYKKIDKCAKRNTIHKNAAARKKSRLAKKVQALERELAAGAAA